MIDAAAFEQAVDNTVGDRLEKFGFRKTDRRDFWVRFANPPVFVDVDYDVRRSYEITVWVGRTGSSEPPLALADILGAARADPSRDADVDKGMQTSDQDAVPRLLERAAQLLDRYAEPLLEGDPHAFARALSVRSKRAAEYTARVVTQPEVDAADAARREKDFGTVYRLLSPVRDALDARERRRLDYAERHL